MRLSVFHKAPQTGRFVLYVIPLGWWARNPSLRTVERTNQMSVPPWVQDRIDGKSLARYAQGAIVAFLVVGFLGFGWLGAPNVGFITGGSATKQAETAITNMLVPICADQVVGNPAAVADLQKTQRSDWDDAVMRHVKKVGPRDVNTSNRQFAMACGVEAMARLAKTATAKQ